MGEANVRELTRSFSQGELMDFQWDLLIANFKDPKTVALVRDRVEDISPDSSSHRASVLKVALKKAFELKKKRRQPPVARLLCCNHKCAHYRNSVSYTQIVADIGCQFCRGFGPAYLFKCANCESVRRIDSSSCERCGSRFV